MTFPANQAEFDLMELHGDPNEVIECTLKLDTHNTDPNDSQGIYDDTYFPAPVTITIEKNNTK